MVVDVIMPLLPTAVHVVQVQGTFVMLIVLLLLQPNELVPITVYVVVTLGDTEILLFMIEPGSHV